MWWLLNWGVAVHLHRIWEGKFDAPFLRLGLLMQFYGRRRFMLIPVLQWWPQSISLHSLFSSSHGFCFPKEVLIATEWSTISESCLWSVKVENIWVCRIELLLLQWGRWISFKVNVARFPLMCLGIWSQRSLSPQKPVISCLSCALSLHLLQIGCSPWLWN